MTVENDIENLRKSWLKDFDEKELKKLQEFIDKLKSTNISPEKTQIFNAFKICKPKEVNVLILGQDPYPDSERAHGYAFSFGNGKKPAEDSLLNIFEAVKKYKDENGTKSKGVKEWNTNLENWANKDESKILLLNTALTYKKGEEHFKFWKPFVKQVISCLIENRTKDNKLVVFLWGVPAQQLFFECINLIEKYKNEFSKNLDLDKLKKLQSGKLVRGEVVFFEDIKIFMTSHPCNRSKWRGISEDAPNHFKACDDFLKKKIWLDFK